MARTLSKNPGYDISRLRRFAQQHLGVKWMGAINGAGVRMFRSEMLDLLDRYYENTQYDDLREWEEAQKSQEYVPIRDRKPRIIYDLPRVIVDKVAAKLVGQSAFPKFLVEGDDDDTAFLRTVIKAAGMNRALIEPTKRMLAAGSVFVRYYLVNGAIQIEYAKSKYCYPAFDEAGELTQVEIKYVYEDWQDLDSRGDPKKKWYRILLTQTADVLFDNPEFKEGQQPVFKQASTAEHGLGWVQGEWFATSTEKFDHDGYSLFADITGFIDELNYSLSQGSQAIQYNQEPQLMINKMDEDEIERLIKSGEKAWNMGREGEGKYLETTMDGAKHALEFRDKVRSKALEIARVVLHDPEKFSGQAQSGEALKQLYAPLIELVDEIRAIIEPMMVKLLIKIAMTCLTLNAQGIETEVITPDGYQPQSLDITVQWPQIFPPTLQDINMMAQTCNTLGMAKIVSRESLTRWIAANTNIIDNPDEELQKIAAEPDLNPFGSFGGPPGQE